MAEQDVTHTLVKLDGVTARQINQNFRDVQQFVNSEVVHSDGTNLPFTVTPTIVSTSPSAVTQDNDLTNKAYVDDEVWDTAWGVVALGSDPNRRNNRTTAAAINSAVSVTITAVAGRRYRITGEVLAQQQTTGGLISFRVYKGGSDLKRIFRRQEATSQIAHLMGFAIDEPAGGSVTYDLRLETSAGTVDARGDANPTEIVVEDVGPV